MQAVAPSRPHGLPAGPVVKICGLTRLEDVLLACDLGAWALGFVFAPSPRRLTPAAARGLVAAVAGDRRLPLKVGVFVDQPAGEIARVVEEVGLDGVQLHGERPRGGAVRAALAGRDRPLLIIQALPVAPDEGSAAALAETVVFAGEEADVVLLDTKTGGRFGGTGTVFRWAVARETGGCLPLMVAGGIGPANVESALRESGAWGVDVSSGVERSPGIKDAQLLARLFERVRASATPDTGPAHTNVRSRPQEGPAR